jgi:hypothetical protein
MMQYFGTIFFLLPTFFKNVTIFLRNVGLVNFFVTFCKMLQQFSEMLGKKQMMSGRAGCAAEVGFKKPLQ